MPSRRGHTDDVAPVRGPAAALLGAVLLAATACGSTSTPRPTPSATATGVPSRTPPSTPSQTATATQTAAPTAPASTTTNASATGWPTYHGNAARTGVAPDYPTASTLRLVRHFQLDGAVYAEPLVVGGTVIVATEGGSLYGIRGAAVAWRVNVGPPVPQSALPCGDIDPTGITGTPVFNPTTDTVYAVTFTSNPLRHVLVAVDPASGAVRFTRVVDPPGAAVAVEQQRAALALTGGTVWVAYGGLYGDCGPYHGYVVGVPSSGMGPLAVYQTPSQREAGIWAPSGPAADGSGHLYVSVGNGASTGPPYDGSDSVVELAGARPVSFFAPSSWAQENAADLDLGSTGPVLLPGGLLAAAGKAGTIYLLRQGALGGIGHPVAAASGCASFGGMAYAAGVLFVPCTSGVRAVSVGSTTLTPVWQAPGNITGSPVVGGTGVFTLDPAGGRLYVLDAASGAVRTSVDVGVTSRFATPTLDAGTVLVGTMTGLTELVSS